MNDDWVDILDAVTREVVDECYGPTATGRCPGAAPDVVVCCAGRRIAPTGAGPEYWMMWVPRLAALPARFGAGVRRALTGRGCARDR